MPTLDPSLSRVGGQSPYSFSLTRDKRENLVWREDSVLFSWNQDLSGREKQTVSLNSLHGSHSTTAAWLCFLTCPLGKLRLPHTDFRVAYKQHVGSCSEVRTFLRVGYSIFSLDCKGCCSGLIAEKYCKKQDAHEGTNWRLLSLAGIERCGEIITWSFMAQYENIILLNSPKGAQKETAIPSLPYPHPYISYHTLYCTH